MNNRPRLDDIPKHTVFVPYVIREIHRLGGIARRKDIQNAVLDAFDIPDELLMQVLPKSGSPTLKNRVSFGILVLNFAGYIISPKRGYWQLSEAGKEKLPDIMRALDARDNSALAEFGDIVDKLATKEKNKRKGSKPPTESPDVEDPEVEVERKMLDSDLEAIGNMDPLAFERLCLQIFKKEGYEEVSNTKQSYDGGFDGVGYLVFGLVRFKVVFECKRYTTGTSISGKDMRAFMGTMSQVNAHKGIFITTSRFTKEAERAAKDDGNIETVDGERLVELLKKHQIATKLVMDEHQLADI